MYYHWCFKVLCLCTCGFLLVQVYTSYKLLQVYIQPIQHNMQPCLLDDILNFNFLEAMSINIYYGYLFPVYVPNYSNIIWRRSTFKPALATIDVLIYQIPFRSRYNINVSIRSYLCIVLGHLHQI